MQTIGERLEEARKKKGISIREAAEATKIRGDYLSKFENNQFDINLTELYVRGFLRTYAQFLRLPVDRILNDYAALGRGEARRQPNREVYGRMDVSISSADERSETPTAVAAEPVPSAPPPRHTPHLPRRGAQSPRTSIDPALVFNVGKWAGVVAIAALLVWGAISLFKSPADRPAKAAATNVTASPPSLEPTITLIALGPVRLKVAVRNPDGSSGEVLLPDVSLAAGEKRIVPKRGPLYLTATALENVAFEENGRRVNIRDQGFTGYSRVQIGR
ncbi:MAG TPA: helix-turn-helix domain-containing protein [Opitutus sp.]|nr:helix-turn-helix domain-containing protein [Opitutus sp.]